MSDADAPNDGAPDDGAPDDPAPDDDFNAAPAATALDVCEHVVRALVDDPDSVSIEPEERRRGGYVLRVNVAPDDMGRVIGRRGRTAQAVRTLVAAAAVRDGVEVDVDFVD